MQRKITWSIVFFVLVLVIAVFGLSYYLHLNNQLQGKKEFLSFLSQKNKLPQKNEEVSLVAVGDISYSRGVEQIVKKQNDINYPFLKIKDYLQGSDLVFGNLETPIIQGREIANFEMIFRSNPGTEKALKEAGFSVLSLANNHTPNFGEEGLRSTFNYLENAGIKYVGAGKDTKEANQPIYIEVKGIRFVFLAYNDTDVVPAAYEASENHAGTAFMRIEKMAAAVKEAKQKADFVIVSMHAGNEYTEKPNDSQINFAHRAIDAGADLIIGHHPHVVQPMEKYEGKYIFYSLGNFVFDQMWSQETKQGLTIKVYFTKKEIRKISFLPVVTDNLAQPRMANNSEAEKILERLDFPLTDRTVYFWDNNTFEKNLRPTIYTEGYKTDNVVSKMKSADLDNNSFQETYLLKNGQLSIAENSKIIWQSPDDWWVDDFILADANNDGVFDINLSLWKSGNFGTSKPFWIKENDMSVKNHLFVYDLINGKMKIIWGSSNLGVPNCEIKMTDINGDNENELIVLEGDYTQKPSCKGYYLAVWKWNGWGFSNEWRSEKGDFSNLEIEKIDGKNHIVIDS